MSWEKLAQNRIDEAIAAGKFDDLPGRGQPLDLTEYFSHSPAERAGVSLLKNAGVVPPEMELLKLASAVEEALTRCTDDAQRARLNAELQEHRVAFALAMERWQRAKAGE